MPSKKMNILFCASEALPFIKTGGLADVAGSLPKALNELGNDVTLVIPAYRSIFDKLSEFKKVGGCDIEAFGQCYTVKLLQADIKDAGITALLVDIPELFDRPDGPYLAADGKDWWDNGERFAIFSKVVVEVAMNRVGLKWKADVVHSNDWQTGLVPALLTLETARPKTIFTIHNMAYQGNFPHSVFESLQLPSYWWHAEEGVEFHDNLSMLKAGIMMSDFVTTVSPTYAKEICTTQYAYGFDGVMQKRRAHGRLSGILNGIDSSFWNPAVDRYITCNYSVTSKPATFKAKNKKSLLLELGASEKMAQSKNPLIGFVGRLIDQKGVDLILAVIPDLIAHSDANFVFVGSGDASLELQLRQLAHDCPLRVFVFVGYSEALAHQVEAGSDLFLMPSRFEPCGLNQMYSLAYGTLPIVHHTGGLADTVVNATIENIEENIATGFVLYDPTVFALKETIYYALSLYSQKKIWRKIQKKAMKQDFSWEKSAEVYCELYRL
jgi:starch synthase